MKRAVLYTRVSTIDQHLETQLLDLRQMAAQRGLEIVQEYSDKISGVKAKRPGLDQMMTDARHGKFDVFLVWASDRVARSVKHFLEVLDELNRLGIEYVSLRHMELQREVELLRQQRFSESCLNPFQASMLWHRTSGRPVSSRPTE